MTETEVTIEEKDIGRQMWDLLQRKPQKNDVVFSVGVKKVKVQAVRFILEAASSVFEREFEEKWDTGVVRDGEGIPLVDVDPVAFQLFVKLLTLDTWSVQSLKALNLSPNTLLNLLSICRRFQTPKAIKNLETAADEFIRSFRYFKDTDECLKLSQSNLATVISSEGLLLEEMEIFGCVCRWAEFQCRQRGMEKTGKNMRSVIGAVLFEIRFPRMSNSQFSKVCRRQSNLLSDQEQLAIYHFIGMDGPEKHKYYRSQLPFKSHARKQPVTKFEGSTLCLTRNIKIIDRLPFLYDASFNYNRFQISNGRIALHGIGFLGPDEDSYFDVTVQITRRINYSVVYDSGRKGKRIFARKREAFHFIFDKPFAIEPTADIATWNDKDYYIVYFWMQGPNSMAVDRYYGNEQVVQAGVTFRFDWWSGRGVAELLYKKI